ncbi:NifB/NifX family molybdenum-iron cluster-binding protein [Clostridium sp. cel8]|jgi:predicted Fe-Mo cluster-binding NifX family protein|uniref:NifB/NifX family molybdenum-iron cluster-binding protein n=1 Tax=unclassified Clostridium TaxID=2614128 RepID=UPI0015F356EF|nr:NifB/NifX family molybdenum-iron cluster-binding protein [Clostridium sp. cel8]MBA5851856.1 NifB/NifX family molybdenum-iron cluster-binding protein [Clostridium sp. cel8]
MKIAVASDGKYVSRHFGHCEGFKIYEVSKDGSIKGEFKPNPGHRPGFLPVFLGDLNVNTIIAGGMGQTAQDLFNQNNIEVVVGAEGNCDDIVKKYIKGELKSTGSVCSEHEYEGNCGN